MRPGASSTPPVEVGTVDPASVRLVILAAGSSVRMGWNKLTTPFADVPLARRVVLGLAELRPLVVATPPVAALLTDIAEAQVIEIEPTAGPSVTLGRAHAEIGTDEGLLVAACDLPFLDARRVLVFAAAVPDDADIAYPVVGRTPGHPVFWSPRARTRIPSLAPDEPPLVVRRDPMLRVVAMPASDEAYVIDVDTPEAWRGAEERARSGA